MAINEHDLKNALVLRDMAGTVGIGRIQSVALASALVGSLTISGLTDPSQQTGTPASWTIAPGASGVQTNVLVLGWPIAWSYANAADVAKATVIYSPKTS